MYIYVEWFKFCTEQIMWLISLKFKKAFAKNKALNMNVLDIEAFIVEDVPYPKTLCAVRIYIAIVLLFSTTIYWGTKPLKFGLN